MSDYMHNIVHAVIFVIKNRTIYGWFFLVYTVTLCF